MVELHLDVGIAYIGQPPAVGRGWTAPDFFATWCVLAGDVLVERGHQRWRIRAGTGCILPADWRRQQHFSPHAQLVSLGLRPHWDGGDHAVALDEPIMLDMAQVARLEPLARQVIALRAQPRDSDAAQELRRRLALDGYALAWLDVVTAAGGRLHRPAGIDPRLGRLRAALAADARLGALNWQYLRQVTGLSRPQLDRLSRDTWGTTVRGQRDRLVLARAHRLLGETGRNLAGIAEDLGASDTSHFVRWFRRHAGHTPGIERSQPARR